MLPRVRLPRIGSRYVAGCALNTFFLGSRLCRWSFHLLSVLYACVCENAFEQSQTEYSGTCCFSSLILGTLFWALQAAALERFFRFAMDIEQRVDILSLNACHAGTDCVQGVMAVTQLHASGLKVCDSSQGSFAECFKCSFEKFSVTSCIGISLSRVHLLDVSCRL